MPDDNVVRPVFGGQKQSAQQASEPLTAKPGLQEMQQMVVADVTYYLEHRETKIAEARECGDTMTNYIFDVLPGFSLNDESLGLRLGLMSQIPLQDLCEILTTSDRADWSEKPHYYGAVYVEFDGRCNAVKEAWADYQAREAPEEE